MYRGPSNLSTSENYNQTDPVKREPTELIKRVAQLFFIQRLAFRQECNQYNQIEDQDAFLRNASTVREYVFYRAIFPTGIVTYLNQDFIKIHKIAKIGFQLLGFSSQVVGFLGTSDYQLVVDSHQLVALFYHLKIIN